MDTLTYVVIAGWVLMYFMPSFVLAAGIAAVMALGAGYIVNLGNAVSGADLVQTMLTYVPIAFIAIFVAWPLGVAMRWIFRRLKGSGA